MTSRIGLRLGHLVLLGLCAAACGDDDNDGLTVADRYGIGAQCSGNNDCLQPQDQSFTTECLTEFTGGYCGIKDCASNTDCPPGSACASLEGSTYCFRICRDKGECNANRGPDVLSNCSSNIDLLDGSETKLCVPSSSGL